jgi:SpoU rRNA methylase family enzyme
MNDETKLLLSQWPVLSRKTKERMKEIQSSEAKDFIAVFNMLVQIQQELDQSIEQLRPRAVHLHNDHQKTEKTLRRASLKRVK